MRIYLNKDIINGVRTNVHMWLSGKVASFVSWDLDFKAYAIFLIFCKPLIFHSFGFF